jgi:Family of unknown function (DUF6282)
MSTAACSWTDMPTPSYDLHLHPGAPPERWGDGNRVWQAARAAGVKGFVWKDHRRHTPALCAQLPTTPVEAIGSASLNAWASPVDVAQAIGLGAHWLWGPTQTNGSTAWDLPLPSYWAELADWLTEQPTRMVLATGHADRDGRVAFAELAAEQTHLLCSITHSLLVPLEELRELADRGCAFEIDAYTFTHDLGRPCNDIRPVWNLLSERGASVYFTSDGGQAATGNPFEFGARVLDDIQSLLGPAAVQTIAIDNPATVVAFIKQGVPG